VNETRKPIVVVGSINMDLVARTPTIPLAGQTLIGSAFTTTPGGKGANQAVAVARLGYPVHMVGAVGDDVFGQALLDNLANAGVDTAAVTRVIGPSGVAPIMVADNGENSIVVVSGANGEVDCPMIDRQGDLLRSAGMVLCQLELPMASVARTLSICAEARVPVMLDPAPAALLAPAIWKQIAWITPNETEAAFYIGRQSEPEGASRELLSGGVKGVVLKRGSEGAYIARGDADPVWVPPFRVKAVDTVGAGDCFNGAFAVALLEGNEPTAAARFASAAAALSVTRSGAQSSMPARAEVNAFLAENEQSQRS
jgi:ribokinase